MYASSHINTLLKKVSKYDTQTLQDERRARLARLHEIPWVAPTNGQRPETNTEATGRAG